VGKNGVSVVNVKSQIVLVAYLMRVYEEGGVLRALHLIASAHYVCQSGGLAPPFCHGTTVPWNFIFGQSFQKTESSLSIF
jgi:hypothetical protein